MSIKIDISINRDISILVYEIEYIWQRVNVHKIDISINRDIFNLVYDVGLF
jgi:hypothetical protein